MCCYEAALPLGAWGSTYPPTVVQVFLFFQSRVVWLTAIQEGIGAVTSCQLSLFAAALLTHPYLHFRAGGKPLEA